MVGAEAFTYISMASSLRLTSPWETILALSCGGLLLLSAPWTKVHLFFQKFGWKMVWLTDPFSHHESGNPTLNHVTCDLWHLADIATFFGLSLTTAVNSHHGIPGAKLKCSLGWPKWGFYFYWYPASTHTNGLLNRQLVFEPLPV